MFLIILIYQDDLQLRNWIIFKFLITMYIMFYNCIAHYMKYKQPSQLQIVQLFQLFT